MALRGGEQDVIINDPWRQLGRRYQEAKRDNTLPAVQVNRPGPDTEGFYSRLRRTMDISSAANRVSDQLAENAAARRALAEAKALEKAWGSVDLSGVNPKFLEQQGISYQDLSKKGVGGVPSGRPLSSKYGVTSGFGTRKHPITRVTKLHDGIDYGAPSGTPIYATHSGKIISAGSGGSAWGNQVLIAGSGGITTRYAHQSRVAVRSGQQVTKGQLIGYVGSTGYATGPHLHYAVYVNGKPVNPNAYM